MSLTRTVSSHISLSSEHSMLVIQPQASFLPSVTKGAQKVMNRNSLQASLTSSCLSILNVMYIFLEGEEINIETFRKCRKGLTLSINYS